VESKSEWEAMRRDPAEEEECRGWFYVAVMGTLSALAKATVVVWREGSKGNDKEKEQKGDGVLRCELAMCRKGSGQGHSTHVV